MNENKYKGWLLSNNLIKRSLAIVGHLMIGQLIIFVIIMMFCFVLGIGAGFMSVMFGIVG